MSGFPTPATLTPTAAFTRRLFIPGDSQFLANVSGALLELTYPENWADVGAVSAQDAADAALVMYNRYLVEVWSMIGAIVPCVTADTPAGCLECDGTTYSGGDYPDLFAVLDPAWKSGSDFTVPDLRGRIPLGVSSGHLMASTGGVETVTLSIDEMPSHSHSTGNSLTSAAVMPGEGPVLIPNPIPAATGNTGGGSAHQNLPPFQAVRYVLIAK